MKGYRRRARRDRGFGPALLLAVGLLATLRLPTSAAAFSALTGGASGWAAGSLTAPSAVGVALACPGGVPRAVLTWTPAPDPATGYRIDWSGGSAILISPRTATGTNVDGLSNSTAYTFTVRASRGAWQSLGVTVSLTTACPPRFVAASSVVSHAAGAFTLTVPAAVEAGDVLVAAVGSFNNSGGAPPGWSLVRRVQTSPLGGGDAGNDTSVFLRTATAGDAGTSVAFPVGGNGEGVAAMVAYRGARAPSPVDVHAGAGYGFTTTPSAPSVTTTVPGTLLLMLVNHENPSTFGVPPGMTQRLAGSSADQSVMIAEEPRPAAGATGPRTATASSNDDGIGFLVALAPG